MTRLRSAVIAGVVALSCLGMSSQPADAQMHGGGGFNGGHGGFNHQGFCCNRFFFGFGFPGFGFGGYPYYPYYPAYYPPYYPYYPPHPAGYPAAAPAYPAYPAAAPATASPAATRAVDPVTVMVQAELRRQGYDVGPIDGLLGPRTTTAIREYQQRNGLPVDGVLSHSLLDHMQAHPTG